MSLHRSPRQEHHEIKCKPQRDDDRCRDARDHTAAKRTGQDGRNPIKKNKNPNAMTIAVAMPATTTAPSGPDRTISSTRASSVSVDAGASWETIMASSLQRCRAERVGFG